MLKGEILILSYKESCAFIMPRHYAGRKPVISRAFGWYIDNQLEAVCTFGKPASPSLCRGIMNGEYVEKVYELNRLCRKESCTLQLSQFVSACLRLLRVENWIIVSYSDTGMYHNGYIYQACNFLYTGMTKKRTDKYTDGNKHSRHYSNDNQNGKRKIRTSKHRYIYFCTQDKKLQKEWKLKLAYKIKPYPKGINKNYILGDYYKPEIINN
jgi:hypothetical protein